MKCKNCGVDINSKRKYCSQDCFKKYKKVNGAWNKGKKWDEWMSKEGAKKAKSNLTAGGWCKGMKGIQLNTGRTHFKKGHQPSEEQRERASKMCIKRNKESNPVWDKKVREKISSTLIKRFGGITKGDDVRKLMRGREWREKVRKRDNYTCQKCGSKERLHAHHKKGWHQYPKLRYVVSNGILLCFGCHLKKHNKIPKKLKSVGNLNNNDS